MALLVLGCGKKGSDTSSADTQGQVDIESTEAPPASQAQPAPSTNPTTVPLTKADIERWEKGIAGEMKAIEEAGAKMKTARSGEDTVMAMMGVQETATSEAGAQAAGLEHERYKFVRSNLSAVVGYLTPSQGGIDTTMLSQAQRDEMRQMNEARIKQMQQEVPAEVVEALRPRAVELRKKSWELIGARLKGAGVQ
jgi:hypothetical protein